MRTGLSAVHIDLPWYGNLSESRHTRIHQVTDLLGQEIRPLSRHFLMNRLEADTYALRAEAPERLSTYDTFTEQHHAEMDSIRPSLVIAFGGLPLLETYQQASIRSERAGESVKALQWARRGLEIYGDDAFRQEWVDDLESRVVRLSSATSRPARPIAVMKRPPTAPMPGTATQTGVWHVGMRVTHDAHGMGKVVGVLDEGVLVDFGESSNKARQLRSRDRRLFPL